MASRRDAKAPRALADRNPVDDLSRGGVDDDDGAAGLVGEVELGTWSGGGSRLSARLESRRLVAGPRWRTRQPAAGGRPPRWSRTSVAIEEGHGFVKLPGYLDTSAAERADSRARLGSSRLGEASKESGNDDSSRIDHDGVTGSCLVGGHSRRGHHWQVDRVVRRAEIGKQDSLDFVVKDSKLTGKMKSNLGESDVLDGKVDGDKVTFGELLKFEGMEVGSPTPARSSRPTRSSSRATSRTSPPKSWWQSA